jgi:hypothetical protein
MLCVFAARAVMAAANADNPERTAEIALSNALHRGDVKGALALFDPKMPGFAQIRAAVDALLASGEAALSIDPETGIWTLDFMARDVAAGATHRQAKVTIAVREGLIEKFDPAGFLAPPQGREAWDLLFAFATQLQNEDAAPGMQQFDRSMPGYEKLKAAVAALWARFQIEPSLDLLSNEGDDAHRTLRIDWTLTLHNPQDPVDSPRREASVACQVEKQGKTWKIAALTPADFFDPPKP